MSFQIERDTSMADSGSERQNEEKEKRKAFHAGVQPASTTRQKETLSRDVTCPRPHRQQETEPGFVLCWLTIALSTPLTGQDSGMTAAMSRNPNWWLGGMGEDCGVRALSFPFMPSPKSWYGKSHLCNVPHCLCHPGLRGPKSHHCLVSYRSWRSHQQAEAWC